MCGIAGIVHASRSDPRDAACLQEMLRRLTHRGPDDQGVKLGGQAALGHRRLSIIDLETGRQPVANEDGSIVAVVNGELYNFRVLRDELMARGHRFRTAGDAECLVHLYEQYAENCVDHLSGMFAFALWDEPRRRLLLARDRLGVKPLYYALVDERLLFASELKALLAGLPATPQIDPTAVVDYLTFGFIPSPKSVFKAVRKLRPAHLLIFQGGTANLREYWKLRYDGWDSRSPERNAEAVWTALGAATRSRLIADVPIGTFLSGGLDSGAVAAISTELSRAPITSITCGFSQKAFDERSAASRTSRLLKTDHRELIVEPDVDSTVERLAWHFDEPFADASAIPTYYLSLAARQIVKVALSGDGGDEVLAGYRRYRFDQYEEAIRRRVPNRIRRPLCSTLAAVYPRSSWLPRVLRARATLRNLAVDGATAHGWSVATQHPGDAAALLSAEVAIETRDYDPLDCVRELYARCDAPDHLSKCQYVDIFLGLADGILVKVDRASMAHGLEVRSPMLDYRFVEAAWRVPPSQRIHRRRGKEPLRRAVRLHVGENLSQRSKSGFEAPLDDWFRGILRPRFEEGPLAVDAPVHCLLSRRAIRNMWNRFGAVGGSLSGGLWKVLMLDAWLRQLESDPCFAVNSVGSETTYACPSRQTLVVAGA